MAFPLAPTDGQQYTDPQSRVWKYRLSDKTWNLDSVPASGLHPLNNMSATVAPTASDSTSNGYSVGSNWFNTTTQKLYICVDATATSAIWSVINKSGWPLLAADPAAPASGDYWYNTTTNQYKSFDGGIRTFTVV